MKLSAFGSLATSAFDTARSTIRAMAEAAQGEGTQAEESRSGIAPAPTAPAAPVAAATTLPPVKPIEAAVAAAEAVPPKPAKPGRVGTRLDALA